MTDSEKAFEKEPIDAVVAWVDGTDPKHLQKRIQYSNSLSRAPIPGAESTRFHSFNEVTYCVLSILKFAPFINKIYIVTDDQNPKIDAVIKQFFPERFNDIRRVDHLEIFEGYEELLPTFNSIAISSMLWRIKGLANQFVYFNDDIFCIRPLVPEVWFKKGRPVLRGQWHFPPFERLLWDGIKRFFGQKKIAASFQIHQWRAAQLFRFQWRYFRSGHTPLPMRRDHLENFYTQHPELLASNISSRFRTYEQFNTVALSSHLEIRNGNKNRSAINAVYMQPHHRGVEYVNKKFNKCLHSSAVYFLCIQSLDQASQAEQEKVKEYLDKIFKN